jgi:hypothetical protein
MGDLTHEQFVVGAPAGRASLPAERDSFARGRNSITRATEDADFRRDAAIPVSERRAALEFDA